jgi:hypothetical protein
MRLVLFRAKGAAAGAPLRVGAQVGDSAVADVSAALADSGVPGVSSMRVFLEMGDKGKAVAASAIAADKYHVPVADVDLRAPIYDP